MRASECSSDWGELIRMRIRARQLAIGVIAFNLVLLALTFGLSQQAQIQNPMIGRLVEVDDTSIHVIDTRQVGYQAPIEAAYDALVLIHGASTSALDFANNLLPELSTRHPLIALDRPGHGYSGRGSRPQMDKPAQQADVILDTLAEMQIESPVLIGHSWAGSVVLAAMLTQHKSVVPAAGVLIAGVTHPFEREDSTPTTLAIKPFIGPIFRWQFLSPIGRMAIAPTVEQFFSPDKVPDNYVQETGLYLSLRPETYLYNALDTSRLVDNLTVQSENYAQITTPLLSIAASEDHVVVPADHHDKLIQVLPEVQAVEIAGAGHSPHHTRTDEIIAAIEAFVGGLK